MASPSLVVPEWHLFACAKDKSGSCVAGVITGRGVEFSAVWVSAQNLTEAIFSHLSTQVPNAEVAPSRACPRSQPMPVSKASPVRARVKEKSETKIMIRTQSFPKLAMPTHTANQTGTGLSYRDINSSEHKFQDSKFTGIHTFNFLIRRYFENSCC